MATIFVVHGMGSYEKDWWEPTEKKLKELLRYDTAPASKKKLESLMRGVNFVPVLYDDSAKRLQDATNTKTGVDSLADVIKENHLNKIALHRIDEWKKDAGALAQDADIFQKDKFVKDAIWDVFLVMNRLTRHYLVLKTAQQIIEYLKGHKDVQWGILAHSLGTGLVHDVLNLVYDELIRGGGNESANVVGLMANFTLTIIGPQLMTRDPLDLNDTKVWPCKDVHGSACRTFIGARHRLDPLSYLAVDMPSPTRTKKPKFKNIPEAFEPDHYLILGHDDLGYMRPDLPPIIPGSSVDDMIKYASSYHALETYMASPLVHLPFLFAAKGNLNRLIKKPEIVTNANAAFKKDYKPRVLKGDLSEVPDIIASKKKAKLAAKLLEVLGYTAPATGGGNA